MGPGGLATPETGGRLRALPQQADGKHDLHLEPASRLPDHTWGHGLPWVSPKRRVSGAYRLTGFACAVRTYRTKLQATSTDLFFGAVETSKGGSDIIDCLPRANRTALSLELLGISHTQNLGRRPRTAL